MSLSDQEHQPHMIESSVYLAIVPTCQRMRGYMRQAYALLTHVAYLRQDGYVALCQQLHCTTPNSFFDGIRIYSLPQITDSHSSIY